MRSYRCKLMPANEWPGLLLLQAARSKCFMSPDLGVSRLIRSRTPLPTAQLDESFSMLLHVFYCCHEKMFVVTENVMMTDEVATRETKFQSGIVIVDMRLDQIRQNVLSPRNLPGLT